MRMLVSTKGRYALRIMIDLAEHQRDGYIPLKETAGRQGISEKYLEGIIKILTEGSLAPVSCLESPDALSCERMDCCRTLPMWRGLDHLINNYLDNITLADLIQPEEPWSNYVI